MKPGQSVSWFRSQKDLEKAIAVAPDWIPNVLKDPDKAAKFADFLQNPSAPKKSFGFRFPIDKNAARGVTKGADGSIQNLRHYQSVYAEYCWHPTKAGGWEVKLKTIYPRRD